METLFRAVELAGGQRVTVQIERRVIAGEAQTFYTVLEDGRSFTRGEFWKLFREASDGDGLPDPL